MLQEIQVISNSGLPLLSFNSSEEEMAERSFLQAGFLTAVSEFSKEVNNGDLKLIETDSVSYLMKKNKYYTSVFTFDSPQQSFAEEQQSLQNVNNKVLEEFGEREYTPADMNKDENQTKIQRLITYLSGLEITSTSKSKFIFESQKIFQNVENLLYKSVGYVPGQCNIGKEGRLQRLTYGLILLVISLVVMLTTVVFGLPLIVRELLVVVNIGAFVCILQYFHRFCVFNGALGYYDMDNSTTVKNVPSSGHIQDKEAMRKDRIKVLKILAESIVLGVLLTVGYVFIPA